MNPITRAVAAACIAALATFGSESFAADAAKEIAAMAAVDQEWEKAYNSGNADALANLYDEQAVSIQIGKQARPGRGGNFGDGCPV